MKKKICNYIVIFYKCKDSVCSVKKKKKPNENGLFNHIAILTGAQKNVLCDNLSHYPYCIIISLSPGLKK